jgi:hypothetical protein
LCRFSRLVNSFEIDGRAKLAIFAQGWESAQSQHGILLAALLPQGRELRRLVFSSGFFRIKNLRISVQAVPEEIHVPYWAGYRGTGPRVHVAVMDGGATENGGSQGATIRKQRGTREWQAFALAIRSMGAS